MKALVDGDILTYRIGFTTEDEEDWVARSRLRDTIAGILQLADCEDYQVYITSTDKSNFRYTLYPEYKANRTQPKPKYYDYLRGLLKTEYSAVETFGCEADDLMGMHQEEDTCILTIDKDLNMIPGWHYNWVKDDKYEVSRSESWYNFYTQLLIGDKGTDNIPGCPGIGAVKAAKLLHTDLDEDALYEIVAETYKEQYEKKGLDNWEGDMERNASLLWILRNEPEFPIVLNSKSEYTRNYRDSIMNLYS